MARRCLTTASGAFGHFAGNYQGNRDRRAFCVTRLLGRGCASDSHGEGGVSDATNKYVDDSSYGHDTGSEHSRVLDDFLHNAAYGDYPATVGSKKEHSRCSLFGVLSGEALGGFVIYG